MPAGPRPVIHRHHWTGNPDTTQRSPITATGRWPGHLAALLAGVLQVLSLAPFSFWPAGIAAIGLLYWLLQRQKTSTVILRCWLFGVGLYGSGISWIYVSIHEHGNAPPLLAGFLVALFTCLLALLPATAGACYRWISGPAPRLGGLIFAACWVLVEWLRSWLLTGFPWLYSGYGHIDTALAGWAPVAGVLGITLIATLTGVAVADFLSDRSPRRLRLPALAALLWIAGWGLQQHEWVHLGGNAVRVGMIQPNIPQTVKWQPLAYGRIIASYRRLSSELWNNDIIVWPEAAIPRLYQRASGLIAELDSEAASHGASLITGIPFQKSQPGEGDSAWYNSAVVLGNGEGQYFKQRLVPFGEYVPLAQWLRGLISFFDLPMSHMSWGAKNQPPLQAGPWKLAPFICYEIVYADLVARDTAAADFILTISNDSWFGRSIGPLQHFQMARMRALENGRYLIRSTNNGITAIVDHRGQVTHRSEPFTRTTLQGEARPMQGRTPFSYLGSLPTVFICLLTLGLTVLSRQSTRP